MQLKIGILLPRSDMFPTLALDFLNGLKLAFNDGGSNVFAPEIIVESIGNATGDAMLKPAEKMILQENVDLILAFCSFFSLKDLVGIFNAYKKPLIHIDLGGNVLKTEHHSPFVIHHTLNLYQSSYLSGVYAANNLGKNAALAVSFYDGGYHLTDSFARGFTENGGKIISNYVSPMDYKSESFHEIINGFQKTNPDFVYLLFSYKEGNKIFETISESSINGKIPILASPLLTDETTNLKDYKIELVSSVASWAFDVESGLMNDFQTSYSATYKAEPNIISLLGFEIGLTITQIVNENENIPSELGEFVSSLKVNTPRGELTYSCNAESHISSHKIRNFDFNGQRFTNKVIDKVDCINQTDFYEKFKDLPYSGWQNPFIIT